jgi:hypothetical protein
MCLSSMQIQNEIVCAEISITNFEFLMVLNWRNNTKLGKYRWEWKIRWSISDLLQRRT